MANFFKRKPATPAADQTTAVAAEPKPRRRDFSELKPDPDKIGISGSVPFVRLPDPTTLFADRAARLTEAAPGHPLEAYLRFVAEVARVQAAIQAKGPAPAVPDPADLALRSEHGMPPLSRHSLEAGAGFDDALLALLAELDLGTAPEASAAARDALRAASREDRLDLALQIFEGALPVDRIAECVFVAAALQVRLAEQAARLDTRILKPVADGVCPCCGGSPVASVVVAWTPADKARYLSCSLCGTYWNHVRIRCTACGDGEGVSYYGLDEVSKDVQVETCTTCHSYIKHLHQHRAPALDPVADDIASYGLDLKIAEDGFRRAGLNLLFVI
ncbi:formate dehydrogenase accessory protein FdhE [Methylobacterium sp. P1-11]|uniref:formate dehydrogenase accessory protein FdhE n=1 Tax=Methylobacterium sp. P1-11 TaxID=2024616 RepID=UPI0011EBB3A7|nr:formate dehydrogenase accessory protein FdhE [Methylobacterium sp. P1-11]KAA0124087.1 formate dehydrogenase accessory protein FdhE [Methylobacterium sp. P1-11]